MSFSPSTFFGVLFVQVILGSHASETLGVQLQKLPGDRVSQ